MTMYDMYNASNILQVTAFIHGHRTSWHSPDMVRVLHLLQWQEVTRYLPLQKGYFEDYGPWFTSYPAAPERHLEPIVATNPGDYNATDKQYEVGLVTRRH